MKLSLFNKFSRKAVIAGAFVIAAVAGIAFFTNNAQAVTINSEKNCDNNAVVYCGAQTSGGLIDKYKNGVSNPFYSQAFSKTSIHAIYDFFNISSGDIDSMNNGNVKVGSVTRGGDVKVDGNVVATGAITAGRISHSNSCGGSTPHPIGNTGKTFYTRKPCVTFQSDSLAAYVVMKNGVFQFAILASCGNPVKATPKPPAPKPTHKACVNNACSTVNGAGKDSCKTNSECKPAPKPTHKACVNNACSIVNGAGSDTCSSSYDCQPPTPTCTPTPSPYQQW